MDSSMTCSRPEGVSLKAGFQISLWQPWQMDSLLQNYNSDDDQEDSLEKTPERESQPSATASNNKAQDGAEHRKRKLAPDDNDKAKKSNSHGKEFEATLSKRHLKDEFARDKPTKKPAKKKQTRSSSSSSDDSGSSSSSSSSSSSGSGSSSDSSSSTSSSSSSSGDRKSRKKTVNPPMTEAASSSHCATNAADKPNTSSSTSTSTKHNSRKVTKMPSPPPSDRRSPSGSGKKRSVKQESTGKPNNPSTEKRRTEPAERVKHRDRSNSRDRYDSKRHDKGKDRRDRDDRDRERSSKHHREQEESRDKDRRADRYSSRGSNDKRDKRDKYDRYDRKDRDRSRDRKDKRENDREHRYRRSSSRDRKRRSSIEKGRRRSRSRSKSPVKSHFSSIKTMPQNEQPPLSVAGIPPNVIPMPAKPAFIPPLMGINVGPIDLPQRPSTNSELPIDSTATLSRSSLIRSNVKAAQLEKMGIDVLQQSKKATESVPLPSYYNPGVVNPVRYADQVQKRKLLWSHKSAESKDVSSNISKWEQAKFSQDKDGKMASKFLRLMGVKDGQKSEGSAAKPGSSSGDSINRQEELFSTMEQQYEVARQVTHTMRGVGLGFSSQPRTF
ncbi:arginine/serine-rich coiled-coil protein 2-like isoform X2 [Toxorhynchites rutilus septentrionalis]|uniref:arginine/serine-rich coiled-coil protein 2-like isoform X2 n=1 Tax=Toxorhynchites rutilus septentrionalis TaxID=329112 RepID=UPI00247AF17E|nr:arginine/serine-rich coiled-coil protein 2-like isoform X2 [Toxorhynchites rutilus septentrionalis]